MSRGHTPGNWEVIIDDTGGINSGWPMIAVEGEDEAIVHFDGFHQEFWGDLGLKETLANAYLISAAPDLLAALKEMVKMYEAVQPAGGYQGVYEIAVEAIKKATNS